MGNNQYITNDAIEQFTIKVHEIPSGFISPVDYLNIALRAVRVGQLFPDSKIPVVVIMKELWSKNEYAIGRSLAKQVADVFAAIDTDTPKAKIETMWGLLDTMLADDRHTIPQQ